MILLYSFFSRSARYVWQPAITIRDGQMADALNATSAR